MPSSDGKTHVIANSGAGQSYHLATSDRSLPFRSTQLPPRSIGRSEESPAAPPGTGRKNASGVAGDISDGARRRGERVLRNVPVLSAESAASRWSGGEVRLSAAVQVHRTASHERSPPPN